MKTTNTKCPTFDLIRLEGGIAITANGIPHIGIRNEQLIAFQSWVTGTAVKKYCIEIILKDGETLLEYDKRDKWEAVLELFKLTFVKDII